VTLKTVKKCSFQRGENDAILFLLVVYEDFQQRIPFPSRNKHDPIRLELSNLLFFATFEAISKNRFSRWESLSTGVSDTNW